MGLFSKKSKLVKIYAPADGEVVGLDKVEDEVFSGKMMGDGLAIVPANGDFVSPMTGELASVFPTKHAYGFREKSGVEVLVHIGLDTVNLDGEGFESFVKKGDKVSQGDPMVKVDLKFVKPKVPSITTPIIVTNANGKEIKIIKMGKVKKGELIATVG